MTNQVNSVLIIDFDLVTLLVSDFWFLNEVLYQELLVARSS